MGQKVLSTTDLALDSVAEEAEVLTALSLKAHPKYINIRCHVMILWHRIDWAELGLARMYVAMIIFIITKINCVNFILFVIVGNSCFTMLTATELIPLHY